MSNYQSKKTLCFLASPTSPKKSKTTERRQSPYQPPPTNSINLNSMTIGRSHGRSGGAPRASEQEEEDQDPFAAPTRGSASTSLIMPSTRSKNPVRHRTSSSEPDAVAAAYKKEKAAMQARLQKRVTAAVSAAAAAAAAVQATSSSRGVSTGSSDSTTARRRASGGRSVEGGTIDLDLSLLSSPTTFSSSPPSYPPSPSSISSYSSLQAPATAAAGATASCRSSSRIRRGGGNGRETEERRTAAVRNYGHGFDNQEGRLEDTNEEMREGGEEGRDDEEVVEDERSPHQGESLSSASSLWWPLPVPDAGAHDMERREQSLGVLGAVLSDIHRRHDLYRCAAAAATATAASTPTTSAAAAPAGTASSSADTTAAADVAVEGGSEGRTWVLQAAIRENEENIEKLEEALRKKRLAAEATAMMVTELETALQVR